jgi:hypothetical protein
MLPAVVQYAESQIHKEVNHDWIELVGRRFCGGSAWEALHSAAPSASRMWRWQFRAFWRSGRPGIPGSQRAQTGAQPVVPPVR